MATIEKISFDSRKVKAEKIEEYLAARGFGKLGDNYSKQTYASDNTTVVVERDIYAFDITLRVRTTENSFLEELRKEFSLN